MKSHTLLRQILSAIIMAAFTYVPTEVFARSEYWEQKVSLFELIPVEAGDIVFLGNSITDGGEFGELFNNPSIKNRGISSDVISGVMERLDQVTEHSPSKIFLLIGINDISHNLTVDDLANQYENLVKAIRRKSPETKLYVQSIMPINNDFARYKNLKGKESTIKQLNERLNKIAKNNGATYIDLWTSLADSKTGKLKRAFTNDGLHLLGKGYEAWANAIRPMVEE